MGGLVIVLVTAPRERSAGIARTLVEERLAACVNIVGPVRSVYWWEGRVEDDSEDLLIVKTKECLLPRLMERIREVHPYSVPEIIAIRPLAASRDYEEWAVRETLSCEG